MKTQNIEKRVTTDAQIMEEYLYRDGEVPPVVFFHFPKINRKIANMMNQVPVGKLPVKQGFFLSLNDPILMDNRLVFFSYLGTILAAMELLEVLPAPESVVFIAEGWASTKEPTQKMKRPSQDPQAKDVFISTGLDRDGNTFTNVQEKRIKMVKRDGRSILEPELVPYMKDDDQHKETHAGILEAFFDSYHDTIKKMAEDKSYEQFQEQAAEDPVEAFRQGMQAAMTMTQLQAFKDQI